MLNCPNANIISYSCHAARLYNITVRQDGPKHSILQIVTVIGLNIVVVLEYCQIKLNELKMGNIKKKLSINE